MDVEHGPGCRGYPGIGARAGKVVGEADRAGEHHLGHQGAVAVGARDEHADVVGAVLVDPARAVEPQHLPGRGGGDHDIADVVDRRDQTRQLDDIGVVAIKDQDGAGAHRNPGARDRLEGDVACRAVPDDVDLLVGRAVHLVSPAGMRAGQLEDHAAQRLGIAQHQGRDGAGERDVDLVGQPGIELAGLVVDRHLLVVLGSSDLGEIEVVAHGFVQTFILSPRVLL